MNTQAIRLGLRENWAQFTLLIVVNAFVGAMVGMERSILPAIATDEFGLEDTSAILSFILVFGLTKAITNFFAGSWSDKLGRRPVLIAGWLVAAPVPFMLMWAPTWNWILFANVFLGISQGLTWSTTVIMKIDLAGAKNRGLAMGLNEFAGYFAVALSALATGYIASKTGLRPEPFYLGIGFVVLGLGLSLALVKETKEFAALEQATQTTSDAPPMSAREVFIRASFKDRSLTSINQAGLVNNLNDGMAWGLFPLVYASRGMDLAQIGILAAIYPAVWGIGQLFTGAWSDRIGRKGLIVTGKAFQAGGIAVIAFAPAFWSAAVGAGMVGAGTAMVYPTLLAAIGDVAPPSWRASAVGVYRLWRDSGYAIGAILAGFLAFRFGLVEATLAVAALNLLSGLEIAVRLKETLNREPANG